MGDGQNTTSQGAMEASRQAKEININRQKIMIVAMLCLAFCPAGFALGADDQHTLIKSLGSAKVSLQQGLAAAQRKGQPISGKFQVEDGKFQLSVYTANNGQFSEVLVDYSTGKIAKSEPITQGGDMDIAKSQSGALAKAKIDLKAAVNKAVKGSRGFRAVSVTPGLKDGHAIASVVLLKGEEMKSVEQSLE